MPKLVVVLSGPVGSGKSTLAKGLADEYQGQIVHIKTHELLKELQPGIALERKALQNLGEKLDRTTGGKWVRDGLDQATNTLYIPDDSIVIIDAVRMRGQVEALRRNNTRSILHIHLTAPMPILVKRYESRVGGPIKELKSYKEVLKSKTEREVGELRHIADVKIDTRQNTPEDVVARVASHIGLYGRDYRRSVDVLVGGQFGSEGKGQVAAYLAPEYDYLVRVGGPNAGHTVFEETGKITFHHLPSGTRTNPNAKLIFGPGGVLNVTTILKEIRKSKIAPDRLSIDPHAMVINDADIKKEKGLRRTIGSTAQGVGQATARKILGRSGTPVLAGRIHALRPFVRDTCKVLERAFSEGKRVFLEGTQGTGLSLHHGNYPYVTSRDTTVAGCLSESGISPSRVRKVIMVCRTYPIRVESPPGNTSGDLSQELTWDEVAKRSDNDPAHIKKTEMTSTTHRPRRVGEFDWALIRKSASLNAPTDIALTFADYIDVKNQDARRFEQLTEDTIYFIEEVERVCAAPVSLISTRFHERSIIDRRTW